MQYILFFIFIILSACSTPPSRPASHSGAWELKETYTIDLRGGSSDLCWDKEKSSEQYDILWSITDRGPNGEDLKKNAKTYRPFLEPAFSPTLSQIKIQATDHSAIVLKSIRLRSQTGKPLTGLPNVDPAKASQRFDEIPVDEHERILPFDPLGLDTEGLICMGKSGFYISEEYGPSIESFNGDGHLIERWTPIETSKKWTHLRQGKHELPAFFAQRTMNRGFEAATIMSNGHLLFILQSEVNKKTDHGLVPMLEWDPQTQKTVALFYYPSDSQGGKIGAATITPSGEIWVLEQNGIVGEHAWQKVFAINLTSAQNVLAEASDAQYQWTPSANLKAVAKKEVLNLSQLGLSHVEKLEGMTMNAKGELFIANDTDFNVPPYKKDEKAQIFKFVKSP